MSADRADRTDRDNGRGNRDDTPRVGPFERFDAADVRALVDAFPLAWVCAGEGAAIEASLLPLIGRYDEEGRLVELIGHMMRANPLRAALDGHPGATILFSGPDAYVGPAHAGRRDWAPTWNYAGLRFGARIAFDDGFTEEALTVLIDAMEANGADPWHVGELGSRYRAMLAHIVGFRAQITGVSGKFKFGQDEDAGTLRHILQALGNHPVVPWMHRFNGGR